MANCRGGESVCGWFVWCVVGLCGVWFYEGCGLRRGVGRGRECGEVGSVVR